MVMIKVAGGAIAFHFHNRYGFRKFARDVVCEQGRRVLEECSFESFYPAQQGYLNILHRPHRAEKTVPADSYQPTWDLSLRYQINPGCLRIRAVPRTKAAV